MEENGCLKDILPHYIDYEMSKHICRNRCVDDIALIKILENYPEIGPTSLRNMGRGNSSKYVCIDSRTGKKRSIIFTFLGRNAEYIVLPRTGYCGCFTRYKMNINRRRICYHMLTFIIDYFLDAVITYEFKYDNPEILIYNFLLENLPEKGSSNKKID